MCLWEQFILCSNILPVVWGKRLHGPLFSPCCLSHQFPILVFVSDGTLGGDVFVVLSFCHPSPLLKVLQFYLSTLFHCLGFDVWAKIENVK